jgi:hypothetical protein
LVLLVLIDLFLLGIGLIVFDVSVPVAKNLQIFGDQYLIRVQLFVQSGKAQIGDDIFLVLLNDLNPHAQFETLHCLQSFGSSISLGADFQANRI